MDGLPTIYLLDTCILVYLVRDKAIGRMIASNFNLQTHLNQSIISVVTVGEMFALARQLAWGPQRVTALQRLLEEVVWVDINHTDIYEAYGELEEVNRKRGRKMSQNDVWIAATAKVAGATLLTADGDFDHLFPTHLNRIRVDIQTGKPIP